MANEYFNEEGGDLSNPAPKKSVSKGISRPQRIPDPWENALGMFGYVWDAGEKLYKNVKRGSSIQFGQNFESMVKLPGGKVVTFTNLGVLLQKLEDNAKRRKAPQKGKKSRPVAQVTTENYKKLFGFLYSG